MKLPFVTNIPETEPVILAEWKVTNFELFGLANSNGKTFDSNGQLFTIRFKLINSFKAQGSDRPVNQFVMQIITKGKQSIAGHKEVERVKIIKTESQKQTKLSVQPLIEKMNVEMKVEEKKAW